MNIPNEYKNLSAIAKASGKRLNNWVNRSEGKKAIANFKLKYPKIDEPLLTKKGRGGGTWGHPELAAIFAAWCDPQFVGFQQAIIDRQSAVLKRLNELVPCRSDGGLISTTQYHRDEDLIYRWLNKNSDGEDCVKWLLNCKWSQVTPAKGVRDLWLWGQFDRLIDVIFSRQTTLTSTQFRLLINEFESLTQKETGYQMEFGVFGTNPLTSR